MAQMEENKPGAFLLQEHSYTKPPTEQNEEPMETTPSQPLDSAHVLLPLAYGHDTLETVFISLLKMHSRTLSNTQVGDCEEMEIAPKALDCLSNEQVNFLVTSNSVNYIAIQQILAQRSKQVSPISTLSQQPLQNSAHSSITPSTVKTPDVNSRGNTTVPVASSGVTSLNPTSLTNALTPNVSSIDNASTSSVSTVTSPINFTAAQIKQLQSQVNELLRQQNIQISPNLSLEQQQSIVSSLLTQQLKNLLSNAMALQPTTSHSSIPSTTTTTTAIEQSEGAASVESLQPAAANNAKKKKESDTKRTPTPFNIYFSEVYPSVQEEHSNLSFSEASKIVSSMWNKLGQAGKQKYYERHEQLKSEFYSKQQKSDFIKPNEDSMTTTSHNTAVPSLQERPEVPKSPLKRKASKDIEEVETREKLEGMCVASGCYNMTVPNEERGSLYCSNECVVKYCRTVYLNWVAQRKQRT